MLQEREDSLQLVWVHKVANPIHLEQLVNGAGQPFISKWKSNLVTSWDDHILLGSSAWVSKTQNVRMVGPH